MPRTCFVIMPFSATATCSQEQWNHIFDEVLKPSIETAGLDYTCRRSVATRGNIVGAILRDLNDSHIVLADLTDRNANVFYELGVRHALKDRTILIAQKQEDIPSDLQAYAYHVYDFKTREGIGALAEKLKTLLTEIDNSPERPDNPVSDFLQLHNSAPAELPSTIISPAEVSVAQPLVGKAAEGINIQQFVKGLVQRGRPQEAKTILRLSRSELIPLTRQIVTSLNARKDDGPITKDKISERAKPYISEIEPSIKNIEAFGLASIQEGWKPGLDIILKLAGNMISITERPTDGHIIRFAQGAPALMAWRILCVCGTKALGDDEPKLVSYILKTPIEVEEASGKFSNRPLIGRRDLFYPDAFLGYADLPMQYIDKLWSTNSHLGLYFESNESYQLALARFFILLVLTASPDETGRPLFPGYRLLSQARRGMSSMTSRMVSSQDYLADIASIVGIPSPELIKGWAERVKLINSVSSGEWSFFRDEVAFPENLGQDAN